MDYRLRELKKQAQSGDPTAIGQFWTTLVRSGILPTEIISCLSKAGHPIAQDLASSQGYRQNAAVFAGRQFTVDSVPVYLMWQLSLALIDILRQTWIRAGHPYYADEDRLELGPFSTGETLKFLSQFEPVNLFGIDKLPPIDETRQIAITMGNIETPANNLRVIENAWERSVDCRTIVERFLFLIALKILHEYHMADNRRGRRFVDVATFIRSRTPAYFNIPYQTQLHLPTGPHTSCTVSWNIGENWKQYLLSQVIRQVKPELIYPWALHYRSISKVHFDYQIWEETRAAIQQILLNYIETITREL